MLLFVAALVHLATAVDNGLARTPPLGWNSWVTCEDEGCTHDFCNEAEVKSVATAMQDNGMQALGYTYVNLDDCWVALERTAEGKLTWDAGRFPSGLPSLISWLHERNFRFGLYTSAGNATCSSGGRPSAGGAPGSRGHYNEDAATFASWEVDVSRRRTRRPSAPRRRNTLAAASGRAAHRSHPLRPSAPLQYVKLDWCGDIKDHLLEGKQAHIDFGNAMRYAGRPVATSAFSSFYLLTHSSSTYLLLQHTTSYAGRPMVLEVVAGYFFMGAGIRSVANTWRFCEDHKDTWSKTAEELACRVDQGANATGAPGGWAFMDFLMTGGAGCSPFTPGGVAPVNASNAHCPGMSDDEYRTEFSLWSLTQSPLIVATDVRNMTAVMAQALLNKEILDIHQSTATPPGAKLATWLCAEPLKCQVWGRKVAADGSAWLVALTNLGGKEHGITAEFKHLGWDAQTTGSVRDLWSHADIGNATGSFSSTVPSHGTRLVRITR